MATEKWVAGAGTGLTWASAFTGSTLNSLASNNALLSDIDIANGTELNLYADVEVNLASAAFVAPNTVDIYLYPLRSDNTTYGDGRFGSVAAGPPFNVYYQGGIQIPAVTAVQGGILRNILLLPGTYRWLVHNRTGVNWAASGNTIKYRTYNLGS